MEKVLSFFHSFLRIEEIDYAVEKRGNAAKQFGEFILQKNFKPHFLNNKSMAGIFW
jgi:hypothetical protein